MSLEQRVPSANGYGRAMSGVPGVSPSDDSSRDEFALPARRDSRCRRCLQCGESRAWRLRDVTGKRSLSRQQQNLQDAEAAAMLARSLHKEALLPVPSYSAQQGCHRRG